MIIIMITLRGITRTEHSVSQGSSMLERRLDGGYDAGERRDSAFIR